MPVPLARGWHAPTGNRHQKGPVDLRGQSREKKNERTENQPEEASQTHTKDWDMQITRATLGQTNSQGNALTPLGGHLIIFSTLEFQELF